MKTVEVQMSRHDNPGVPSLICPEPRIDSRPSLAVVVERMRVDRGSHEAYLESLPFSVGDTTAGSETELQAVVIGGRKQADLPLTIEQSNYFANIMRRVAAGDTPRRAVRDLVHYLDANTEGVWENSWVRFPRSALSPAAELIFRADLLADKKNSSGGLRSDTNKFLFHDDGTEFLRIPISYLLKLALADAVSSVADVPAVVRSTGERLLSHFLSDNTSPETHSFYVGLLRSEDGMGRVVAKETALRFLFTQLLVAYANEKFRLRDFGQKAVVFFSPHPPVRQKALNGCISDAFYRELFMNPCLSGWDSGETKYAYMHLCHEVLSRSQLNAVAKLREAGIVTSNIVILPNISNISLANNGTHVSLGSRKLSTLLRDSRSGFSWVHEKYLGDLVIKIVEHFMPLFVGAYSAAPYRLDFTDFHPERVLGYLPHELDYTHLRMLWRRWKKKAKIKLFGRPVTPFGPEWLDRLMIRAFGLKGDFVPDFRLVDYLVSLMSTERSPALDGRPGNSDRLKKDLADLGIFSPKMSLYLLYKLREHNVMGFSGFEGRHYSLFESFREDLGRAVDLQNLITALAMKYIVDGMIGHEHIPDDPFIESERRQMIFGTAVGIPTFFVRADGPNRFLQHIVSRTARVRPSRRYPGYLRVYNHEYRRALLTIIREDGAGLIEMMGLQDTLADLERRIEEPDVASASGKLTRGILAEAGAGSPFALDSGEFNAAAERYYGETLRERHIEEACYFLETEVSRSDKQLHSMPQVAGALRKILRDQDAAEFVKTAKRDVATDRPSLETLRKLMFVMLIHFHGAMTESERMLDGENPGHHGTPIFRAGNE
jgi:hypothetical protein